MRRPRYTFQQVIDRGYLIAVFKDSTTGRDQYVYRRGCHLCHWDRLDAPVTSRSLQDAARKALREAESERAAA